MSGISRLFGWSAMCAFLSTGALANGQNVVSLGHGLLQCRVAPGLGGRLVSLSWDGGPNLLDDRAEAWTATQLAQARSNTDTRDFGSVVWIGPQSTWWTDQDAFPLLRAAAATWPPDPQITRSPYEIVLQTSREIVLRSQPSPIWGVVMTRRFFCQDDDTLLQEVTVRNTRAVPVARDIWFVHRFPVDDREYVPLGSVVRIEGKGESREKDGLHSLAWKDAPVVGDIAKAFLVPRDGWVACRVPGGRVTIRFAKPSQVSPGQAPVEISRSRNVTGETFEIEHHSALGQLAPGGSMTAVETISFQPSSP